LVGEGFKARRGIAKGDPATSSARRETAGRRHSRARAGRCAWHAKEGWRGGPAHGYSCGLGSAGPRGARRQDERPTGPRHREGHGHHAARGRTCPGVRHHSVVGVARLELPVTHVRQRKTPKIQIEPHQPLNTKVVEHLYESIFLKGRPMF
jgi:hypothetical protein